MSTISRPLPRPTPTAEPLSRYAAISVGGHAVTALLLGLAGWLSPSEPPVIDPEMVIEATLESPAAPTFAAIARSATRTADAAPTQAAANAPTPTAAPPVQSVTGGIDALGEVTIRLRHESRVFSGHAANTDIIVASAQAYVNALNRLYAALQQEVKGEVLA